MQSLDYAKHSSMSDPGREAWRLNGLPEDIAALCRVVQGMLIHDYGGQILYGPPPEGFDFAKRETLPIEERLAMVAADGLPLGTHRPPFERAVGTCRDFALLLCAMLREQGRPARLRCGFADYLCEGRREDHWVCEYWLDHEKRWRAADAQMDEAHRAHLGLAFDPAALPDGRFLTGLEAWRTCRAGASDAALFGHGETTGLWFLGVNLMRDLHCLAGREVSDWDAWRKADDRARAGATLPLDALDALSERVATQGLAPGDDDLERLSAAISWAR